MAVTVSLTDAGIDVHLSGADMVWAIRGDLSVPWSDIVGARVVDAKEAKRRLMWRRSRHRVPGRRDRGDVHRAQRARVREFWSVYRDTELLEIETRNDQPKRIVLQTPDRAELAAAINARVAGRRRSARLRSRRRVGADALGPEPRQPEEPEPNGTGDAYDHPIAGDLHVDRRVGRK